VGISLATEGGCQRQEAAIGHAAVNFGYVAILEFPTFEEAKSWYDNPAYREARQHRLRGGDYRGVIVEGCDAHPRSPSTNLREAP